ncbi:MAG: nucleotidyltransferase family protein [Gammaproteobacteria bacterium]|nr:nucleotidyltransferase family protein [Gammaproteobacteria bacterium]
MNDSSALSQPAHPSSRTPESGSLEVGALVLAAGFSRRFGATKLLAALPENQQISLFEQTLINLCKALPTIIVVYRPELRTQFHEIRDRATQHYPGTVITLVEFKQAELGMGASLAFGASHITDWDAALVCLADMPYVMPSTYSLVAESVRPESIVVPCYRGARGHPIAFGSAYLDELRALAGDAGGRAILDMHSAKIFTLNVDDDGILIDIDTQDDLDKRL